MPSEPKAPLPLVKPGHWETASQEMRANYRDFVGDSRLSIVDTQNRPYPVAKTPFNVRASRPVLLTKGRQKSTETTFFVPEVGQNSQSRDGARRARPGLWRLPQPRTPLTPMPSYQYHFVVLAKEPSRYSFIKIARFRECAVRRRIGRTTTRKTPLHYRVVAAGAPARSVALPDNPLTWTTIAYVLWDEVDPGDPFTPEQERGARRLDPLGRAAHHQRSRFARPAQGLVPGAVSAGHERRAAKDRGRRPGDRRTESSIG